jgi:hypothetical protein
LPAAVASTVPGEVVVLPKPISFPGWIPIDETLPDPAFER